MVAQEAKMYCNCLARSLHIDLHHLAMGGDTLAILIFINTDFGWDSKTDLMTFLEDGVCRLFVPLEDETLQSSSTQTHGSPTRSEPF